MTRSSEPITTKTVRWHEPNGYAYRRRFAWLPMFTFMMWNGQRTRSRLVWMAQVTEVETAIGWIAWEGIQDRVPPKKGSK